MVGRKCPPSPASEQVRNSPWAARKMFEEAEKVEESQGDDANAAGASGGLVNVRTARVAQSETSHSQECRYCDAHSLWRPGCPDAGLHQPTSVAAAAAAVCRCAATSAASRARRSGNGPKTLSAAASPPLAADGIFADIWLDLQLTRGYLFDPSPGGALSGLHRGSSLWHSLVALASLAAVQSYP